VVPAGKTAPGPLVRRLLRHARERLEPFAVPQRVDVVASLQRNDRGKLARSRSSSCLS
jgi:acyl-coenzyme A synthetase/AMP-(fatty) acid ligase